VSTLLKEENSTEVIETSTMVAPQGRRGGCSNQRGCGGQSGRLKCTYCKNK